MRFARRAASSARVRSPRRGPGGWESMGASTRRARSPPSLLCGVAPKRSCTHACRCHPCRRAAASKSTAAPRPAHRNGCARRVGQGTHPHKGLRSGGTKPEEGDVGGVHQVCARRVQEAHTGRHCGWQREGTIGTRATPLRSVQLENGWVRHQSDQVRRCHLHGARGPDTLEHVESGAEGFRVFSDQ